MSEKPKVNSSSSKELDKAIENVDKFNQEVKDLTLDRANQAPRMELEPQTKLSQREIEKKQDIYLKPERSIGSREKFNESYREDYNFAKEYVQFIAENKEVVGEAIEMWTKKFPGQPAEFWKVPVNKPVWGPRYLAEQIKGCVYHRMRTEDRPIENGYMGTITGALIVDSTIPRLDARPANQQRKSVFMGSNV